jgi:hypothetical protein
MCWSQPPARERGPEPAPHSFSSWRSCAVKAERWARGDGHSTTLGRPLVSPGFAGCHGRRSIPATAWLASVA